MNSSSACLSFCVNSTGDRLFRTCLHTCGQREVRDAAALATALAAAELAVAQARLICMRILAPPVVILGTLANLLNIIILTRRGMRSSTNSYLTAVAICDTAFLLNFQLITLRTYSVFQRAATYMYIFPYLMGAGALFSNTATCLTCAFTLERYVAVCHPMYGRKVCTREKALTIIMIVSVATFITSLPSFFEYEVKTSPNTTENSTRPYYLGETVMWTTIVRWGWNYFNMCIFVLLPLLLLVVFNSILIRSILVASRARRQMLASTTCGGTSNGGLMRDQRSHRHQLEQQKTTRMLVVVVIFFCLLQMPSAVSAVISSLILNKRLTFSPIGKRYLLVYGNVVNLLLLFNAALNFILYSCFSLKFRNTFRRVFLHCNASSAARPESRYTVISGQDYGPANMALAGNRRNYGASLRSNEEQRISQSPWLRVSRI